MPKLLHHATASALRSTKREAVHQGSGPGGRPNHYREVPACCRGPQVPEGGARAAEASLPRHHLRIHSQANRHQQLNLVLMFA